MKAHLSGQTYLSSVAKIGWGPLRPITIQLFISFLKSYILKSEDFFVLFCLSELIEELASRRVTIVALKVSNDESTINFEDLSEICTPLQKKWKTIAHTFSIQNLMVSLS